MDVTVHGWIMEELGFCQAVAWSGGLEFWEWNYWHCAAAYRSARSCGHTSPAGYPGSIRWGIGTGDRLTCWCLGGSGTPPTDPDCYRPWPRFRPEYHTTGCSAWGAGHRATLHSGSASRDAHRHIQCG